MGSESTNEAKQSRSRYYFDGDAEIGNVLRIPTRQIDCSFRLVADVARLISYHHIGLIWADTQIQIGREREVACVGSLSKLKRYTDYVMIRNCIETRARGKSSE
ncbi:MAG: hypothetical protein JWM11_3455 [Planctomycetaceae bacterium]|nr:hypothetical protein [Planctomycetaceae bacterium]